jgi:hypothetical protein
VNLRALTGAQVRALSDEALRERVTLAFERMARYQRGTSRGAMRARSIRDQTWAEMDRRGLER